MDRYIVLRDLAAARTAAPFDASPFASRQAAAAGPPQPAFSLGALSKRDLNDAARDPTVAAIAPEMATRLIAPVRLDADAFVAATDGWGIPAVGADRSSRTGAGVTVAVLDTGIDRTHPAFAGLAVVEHDFTGTGLGDGHGHGTHCAGTIFGRDVAGRRIGVARGVGRALIGKVLDAGGEGSSAMLFDGLEWASRLGAQVVALSLGFDFPGSVRQRVDAGWPVDLATSAALEAYRANLGMFQALMRMMRARAAFGQSCVVVAAAGNESRRDLDRRFEIAASPPAAAEGVIAVGALRRGSRGLGVAEFSNGFAQVVAPGVDILSAHLGGGLVEASGTSMACSHVAGVLALWWEALQRLQDIPVTAGAVTARLLAHAGAEELDTGDDPADRGAGMAAAPP